MDPSRLPAYRSSYLLRFHPYPRAKPSTRERIEASARDDEHYGPLQMNVLHPESDALSTLNRVIHAADVNDQIKLGQRRLSASSLVVGPALLLTKKVILQDE